MVTRRAKDAAGRFKAPYANDNWSGIMGALLPLDGTKHDTDGAQIRAFADKRDTATRVEDTIVDRRNIWILRRRVLGCVGGGARNARTCYRARAKPNPLVRPSIVFSTSLLIQ